MIRQLAVTLKTANATLTYTEMGDIVVNSASPTDQTLPAPNKGLWYRISNVGDGEVTIKYSGAAITSLKKEEQALLIANNSSAWWMSKGGGDMSKAEIEAVLTGEITSHTHPAGASTFLDLTDTPTAYTSQAGKSVVVKATEDGVEFVEITAEGVILGNVDGGAPDSTFPETPSTAVNSINALDGDITIVGGAGIEVTEDGSVITVAATTNISTLNVNIGKLLPILVSTTTSASIDLIRKVCFDNDRTCSAYVNIGSGTKDCILDLGIAIDVTKLRWFLFYSDARVFRNVAIYAKLLEGDAWTTLRVPANWTSDANGITIDPVGQYRYFKFYSEGNIQYNSNEYLEIEIYADIAIS